MVAALTLALVALVARRALAQLYLRAARAYSTAHIVLAAQVAERAAQMARAAVAALARAVRLAVLAAAVLVVVQAAVLVQRVSVSVARVATTTLAAAPVQAALRLVVPVVLVRAAAVVAAAASLAGRQALVALDRLRTAQLIRHRGRHPPMVPAAVEEDQRVGPVRNMRDQQVGIMVVAALEEASSQQAPMAARAARALLSSLGRQEPLLARFI